MWALDGAEDHRGLAEMLEALLVGPASQQHFLYFLPEPHGQAALRLTVVVLRFCDHSRKSRPKFRMI